MSNPDPSTITIDLTRHPPKTPLGLMLAPASSSSSSSSSPSPTSSTTIILAGWNRIQNNKLGPVQKLGRVRIGDRLVTINGVDARDMPFRQVMDLLRNMIEGSHNGNGIPLKSLGFAPFLEPSSKQSDGEGNGLSFSSASGRYSFLSSLIWNNGSNGDQNGNGLAGREAGFAGGVIWNLAKNRQLYAFSSTIKRIRMHRINSTQLMEDFTRSEGHQQKRQIDEAYVQYEITCHLTVKYTNTILEGKKEGGEQQITWNVWKRYSEFQALDAKLRRTFGWHMNDLNGGWGMPFPPPHHLKSMCVAYWGSAGQSKSHQQEKHEIESVGILNTDQGDGGDTLQKKFVRRRREEFKKYWESLRECDAIFDFSDPSLHRYSKDMAIFLEVEDYFPRSGCGRRLGCAGIGTCGDDSVGNGSSLPSTSISRFDVDVSTISQESRSSSRCCQTNKSNLLLDGNCDDEIILTKNSESTMRAGSLSGDTARKQKRIATVAKPAFQRRLLDSL